MATFQTLPGFREFYPEELARRSHLFNHWRRAARAYGFSEYDAPVLEPLELYKAKSGEEIEAQLFSFEDKGGRGVALRPEMTPTVCRMVGERAATLKRPIKWFSIGEFYRYERPQKGRGRCFFQLNADIFGESGPEAEIELIALLIQCFAGFGLTHDDFIVRLSDRDLWVLHLELLGLDPPRIKAMLGAIDKVEKLGEGAFSAYTEAFGAIPESLKEGIRSFLEIRSLDALKAVLAADFGGGASAVEQVRPRFEARLADWSKLLSGLEAMGLAEFVQVDLSVVRGLAYYTGFVFEAFDRKGDLRALAGGGRYNDLVGKLGYGPLPAVGFGVGDMTVGLLLEQRGLNPPLLDNPDAYLVIGGENERRAALADGRVLRAAGYRVDYSLKEIAFGKQFKAAAESGAKLALIYGGDELARGVVKFRDLSQRSEREVPREAVAQAVNDFFSAP
jgi:histidyl-tRNA synthetase